MKFGLFLWLNLSMSTCLIRSTTSQSNSYPVVLPTLYGPSSDLIQLEESKAEIQGIEAATFWLVDIHTDYSANEKVIHEYFKRKIRVSF